jgi:hypothetical protein
MSNFYMIGIFQIPQRVIQNIELWYLDANNPEGINLKFKELKKLSGYGFDNQYLLFSNIYGHLFAINIHFEDVNRINKTAKWNISVWDATGSTALGSLIQLVETKESDRLSNVTYKELSRITENFTKEIVSCSSCNKQIKKSEIAGRYFAGIYYQHCWNTKYKAIEAKESYD